MSEKRHSEGGNIDPKDLGPDERPGSEAFSKWAKDPEFKRLSKHLTDQYPSSDRELYTERDPDEREPTDDEYQALVAIYELSQDPDTMRPDLSRAAELIDGSGLSEEEKEDLRVAFARFDADSDPGEPSR